MLMHLLNKQNFFSTSQFDFCTNMSIINTLIKTSHFTFCKKLKVLGIWLEFKK